MNTIECPNCGQEINVEDILFHQAESKVKADFEQRFKQQQAIFLQQKNILEKDIADFNQKKQKENELFQEKLIKVRKEIEADIIQKTKSEVEYELKSMTEEIEKRKAENLELKRKEIEILKKEREFQEKEQDLKLNAEREILERARQIEQKAKENSEKNLELLQRRNEEHLEEMTKSHQFEMKQVMMQLEQQKKLAEEMQKKAGQGSMQLQGEVQEIILEELLSRIYPFDQIEPVPKGFTGADVIQTIYNNLRTEAGKIIYESKRTKNFQEDWIQKLKADQMAAKASIAILVTEVLPRDLEKFGEKNGVWICSFSEVKQVSFILREMILKEYALMEAQKNSGDKMTMLYNYLTSGDFKQRIENILDAFNSMKQDLDKEKRAFTKIWKEREVQIERVITNTIQLHSTFSGIAGNSLPALESLKLPEESNITEE
jgi:hypothetical protein